MVAQQVRSHARAANEKVRAGALGESTVVTAEGRLTEPSPETRASVTREPRRWLAGRQEEQAPGVLRLEQTSRIMTDLTAPLDCAEVNEPAVRDLSRRQVTGLNQPTNARVVDAQTPRRLTRWDLNQTHCVNYIDTVIVVSTDPRDAPTEPHESALDQLPFSTQKRLSRIG
jgi:hypothetical protein